MLLRAGDAERQWRRVEAWPDDSGVGCSTAVGGRARGWSAEEEPTKGKQGRWEGREVDGNGDEEALTAERGFEGGGIRVWIRFNNSIIYWRLYWVMGC